jgi:SpoVK/Ycf46/Vps4 family AAA+-type ATPase
MPIISKKVSELMSMYVGGTEKNIAHAFKRATDDKALLLIDEVDSFLQDRTGAQRSWEQTQVNEMLTQMENFEGVFIASTNLIDSLDAAAMRRFDAKILFGYLKPNQLIDMAIDFCTLNQIHYCPDTLNIEMAHLNAITPGDFALLCRQVNFNPVLNYKDLIARLDDEQRLKGESKNRMGFI